MQKKSNRRLIIVASVIGFMLTGCLFVAYSLGILIPYWQSPSYGEDSPIASIEIETIDRQVMGSPSTIVTTSDPTVVAELVDTLNSGSRISDCRCLWSGYLRLKAESGATIEIQLVPGHGESTYDIREGNLRYSVNRDALTRAMKSAGATLPAFY